jgi:hypothetical protein
MQYLTIPELTQEEIGRFNEKVDRAGSCWLWLAGKDQDGYGGFKLRGKGLRASRVAYRIHRGDPEQLEVCHRCDNPPCVNPEHLFLGTAKDNQRDKWNKGRQNEAFNKPEVKARGSRVNTSKLSEDQAREAIDRLKRGERQVIIARDLGVNRHSIYAIAHGKNWKHLPR